MRASQHVLSQMRNQWQMTRFKLITEIPGNQNLLLDEKRGYVAGLQSIDVRLVVPRTQTLLSIFV